MHCRERYLSRTEYRWPRCQHNIAFSRSLTWNTESLESVQGTGILLAVVSAAMEHAGRAGTNERLLQGQTTVSVRLRDGILHLHLLQSTRLARSVECTVGKGISGTYLLSSVCHVLNTFILVRICLSFIRAHFVRTITLSHEASLEWTLFDNQVSPPLKY